MQGQWTATEGQGQEEQWSVSLQPTASIVATSSALAMAAEIVNQVVMIWEDSLSPPSSPDKGVLTIEQAPAATAIEETWNIETVPDSRLALAIMYVAHTPNRARSRVKTRLRRHLRDTLRRDNVVKGRLNPEQRQQLREKLQRWTARARV